MALVSWGGRFLKRIGFDLIDFWEPIRQAPKLYLVRSIYSSVHLGS